MSRPDQTERLEFKATGVRGATMLEAENSTVHYSMVHAGYAMAAVHAGTGAWRYRRWVRDAHAGLVMLFEPGELHATTAVRAPASYRTLFLDADLVRRAMRGHLADWEAGPHFEVPDSADREVFGAVWSTLEILGRSDVLRCQKVDLLIQTLDLVFSRNSHDGVEAGAGPGLVEARRVFEQIRAEMEQVRDGRRAGGKVVSVAALAQSAGLSPVKLIRAFKKVYGVSPYRYVMSLRIEHARRLIDSGPSGEMTNLSAVAATAGFYDQADFIRHFRRHMKVNPLPYAAAVDSRWSGVKS